MNNLYCLRIGTGMHYRDACQRPTTVLVHLAAGIGNIILATPLLLVLSRQGYTLDLLVDGDYRETADLFRGWSLLRAVYGSTEKERPTEAYDIRIPAIPPFYWDRYEREYRGLCNSVARPPNALFERDEQAYYLEFARSLGCDVTAHSYFLPAAPDEAHRITADTVVLAPGCKTGTMAAKRWPHFPRLAELFEDVVVVGTVDDLHNFDGMRMTFPDHVRSLVGRLSLSEVASVMASAGIVVANDSGLGHIAGAVGSPTILLFGPTPDLALGRFPPNVKILRAGMPCEPCWHGKLFAACSARIDCLERLTVDRVFTEIVRVQAPPLRIPNT
jgi:ADP-heptose:LPS heptosyltransferase